MKKIMLYILVAFCVISCNDLMSLSQPANTSATSTTVSQGELRCAEPTVRCWYDNTADKLMMEISCATEGAKIIYALANQNTSKPVSVEYSGPFTPRIEQYRIFAEKDGYTNSAIRYTPPNMVLYSSIDAARYKYDDKSFLMELIYESDVSADDIAYTVSDSSRDTVTPASMSYARNKAVYICEDGIEREGVLVANGKWIGYMAYKKDYKYSGITRYRMPWKGKPQGSITLTYKGLKKEAGDDYSSVTRFVYTAEYDGPESDVALYSASEGNPLTRWREELTPQEMTFYADNSYDTVTGLSGGLGNYVTIIAFGEGYEDSDTAVISDSHVKLSAPTVYNFAYGWTLNANNSCTGSLTGIYLTDNETQVGRLYYDCKKSGADTLPNPASYNANITADGMRMRLQYRSCDGNTKYIDSAVKSFSARGRDIDPGCLCDWN